MQVPYDSAADTLAHIARVGDFLQEIIRELVQRAIIHDHSKLLPPEKAAFDENTPKLKGLEYGSAEYKASLDAMRPAIDHHQQENRHHPEFFGPQSVNGMNLVDLVEMLCDWRAATERHATGDIRKSIEHNRGRFGISDQLATILHNTVRDFGWDNSRLARSQHEEGR